MPYTNSDGLEVRFGREIGARGFKSGVTTGAGKLRELVLEVDLPLLGAGGTSFTADLNNDGVNEAFNPSNTPIPVGYRIHSAQVINMVTPAGGTSFEVGTYKEDGTVVSVNGLIIAAGTAGAQVGTNVSAATGPWYVGVKATGTYTAGKVKVIIEYMSL